ncbi:methyltransferase domain-containing protein [Elusimicrobiota bacterium]
MEEYDLPDIHNRMLSDLVRTEAFAEAISRTVRKGDVIADVGCGTGILSLLACRAGASRVYAIDRSQTIIQARAIAEANGFGDRITFISEDANTVELPEKVDGVISEWLGNGGLEEGMLLPVMSVRDRWLKPGGWMIPKSVTLYAAPIECENAYSWVDYFNKDVYGFDFRAMRRRAANERYLETFRKEELLAPPVALTTMDIASITSPEVDCKASFMVSRDADLHGMAGWFASDIGGGVPISTAPGEPSTHWFHVYYPIERALLVSKGERIQYRLATKTTRDGTFWRWGMNLERSGELSEEDLLTNSPV